MKEYHLYLYLPDWFTRANDSCSYTIAHTNKRIDRGLTVDTIQACTLSTSLFEKGYRIFIHDVPSSWFEITLGKCERTNREIKMGHNLLNLLLSGEFELNESPEMHKTIMTW